MSTRKAALVLGIALGCARAPAAPPPSAPHRLLGEPLPAFRRATLGGATFDTAAAGGRVVVIELFAAWCAPCQRSLPALQALHRRRPDLVVVGISLDEDEAAARRQIARHRLSFPVIHDPQRALAGRLRVDELPAAFVVDRAGRIAWAGPPDALAPVAAHL